MKINREFVRKGNERHTTLSWYHEGDLILVTFDYDVSGLYSDKLNKIVVDIYEEKKIFLYGVAGNCEAEYVIPEMKGYQFRGLNKSNESKTGVSLLYHPFEDGVGNQWGDTEQYEFFLDADQKMKMLGI